MTDTSVYPMVFDISTAVVGVVGVVVGLAWLVGTSVDIEPIDLRVCLKACTVSPESNRLPSWVNKSLFSVYPHLKFYDWSNLDPVEWNRLRGAIEDYYNQAKNVTVHDKSTKAEDPSVDDVVYNMASLGAYDVAEFEAGVRVLLLMIYDPEIFNSYDRYKTYTKKVDVFIERYTTLEAAKIDT